MAVKRISLRKGRCACRSVHNSEAIFTHNISPTLFYICSLGIGWFEQDFYQLQQEVPTNIMKAKRTQAHGAVVAQIQEN